MNKLLNSLRRRIAHITKHHPSSAPFLSGDTFRAVATHIIDEHKNTAPGDIQDGAILFVSSPFLDHFFKSILPEISHRFTLISHNGDRNITDDDIKNLDARIIHWYGQNCLVRHPHITPLPIGLENQRLYQHGETRLLNKIRNSPSPEKKMRILYKFNPATNPTVRTRALAVLQAHPLTETYSDWRPPTRYLQTLQEYAFVASPVGNGHDCIRTWEALYLKTVPIVTRSVTTEYWQDLGLPVYLIDDWTELQMITATDLEEIYAKMLPKFDNSALWLPYWRTKIKQHS